ncbi:hypothetical protein [Vibrio hibernica]|uniref:hypothetical protein n=1 Tax=Vibrio hibernica TaxID=2587465 RepID=UPI0039B01448
MEEEAEIEMWRESSNKEKAKKSIRKKSNKKSSRQGDDFPKGQINMAEKEQ